MGRYTGPKERLSRREGINLYLKGERSFSEKSGINRKPYIPGQHGPNGKKGRVSNYGKQLREKQRVKRTYGIRERQFKNYYLEANRRAKVNNSDKGLELLRLLETRLDNVVYLLGLAPSRAAARQFVTHRHVSVNGTTATIPSMEVSVNDTIALRHENLKPVTALFKTPAWLEGKGAEGKVSILPLREMIDEGIKESMIIEFYSR